MSERAYVCDSCRQERAGDTKQELLGRGWVWHTVPKKEAFVMCDECEDRYEQRRIGKAGVAA